MTGFDRRIAIVVATILCIAVVDVGHGAVVIPFAVILVGVLPGAGIAEALFGRSLSLANRILLALGLSLVVAILGGMLLAATVGLGRISAQVLLAGVAIGGALAGGIGRPRLPAQSRATERRRRLSSIEVAALVLAAVMVFGVIAYARTPSRAQGVQGYSVLWAKPQRGEIRIGVISQELKSTRYLLVATGGARRHAWRLSLTPGEKWVTTISLKKRRSPLRATLFHFRDGRWVEYRRVRVT